MGLIWVIVPQQITSLLLDLKFCQTGNAPIIHHLYNGFASANVSPASGMVSGILSISLIKQTDASGESVGDLYIVRNVIVSV